MTSGHYFPIQAEIKAYAVWSRKRINDWIRSDWITDLLWLVSGSDIAIFSNLLLMPSTSNAMMIHFAFVLKGSGISTFAVC